MQGAASRDVVLGPALVRRPALHRRPAGTLYWRRRTAVPGWLPERPPTCWPRRRSSVPAEPNGSLTAFPRPAQPAAMRDGQCGIRRGEETGQPRSCAARSDGIDYDGDGASSVDYLLDSGISGSGAAS